MNAATPGRSAARERLPKFVMNLAGDHRPLILARPLETGGECAQLLVGALHFLLGEAALGDVVRDREHARLAVHRDERRGKLGNLPLAILVVTGKLEVEDHALPGQALGVLRAEPGVFPQPEFDRGLAQDFLAGEAMLAVHRRRHQLVGRRTTST